MRRALPTRHGILVAVVLVVACSTPTWAKGSFIAKQVNCSATVSHVVGSLDTRTALTIQNVGTINAYLGSGPIDLVSAQGASGGYIGFTLHAGAVITFAHGQGDPTTGVRCVADGSVRLQVLEEF